MKKFLALSLSDVVFIMLIKVKMPTIVGILTFMSRINFVHEKSFITSGPALSSSATGPRSAVGNVSGYRCVSDCRSRGCKFDPGPVPYFRGD